ncbi:MAG: peptidase inhibitor family I36 protein [Nocardioides sp.]
MSKRVSVLFGFLCVVTPSVIFGVSSPASAAGSDCSINYVCLWGNRNFSGGPWFERAGLGRYNTGFFNNDETSSVWNKKANASTLLYDNTNQDSSGGVVCLPRNYRSRDLNDETPEFDGRISSLWIRTEFCSGFPGIGVIGSRVNP